MTTSYFVFCGNEILEKVQFLSFVTLIATLSAIIMPIAVVADDTHYVFVGGLFSWRTIFLAIFRVCDEDPGPEEVICIKGD